MTNSIRKFRQKAKLTQTELAQKLGISLDSVSRFENGKFQPRAETLKRMSEIFGCSMEELMTPEEPEE